jgi:hypothetical protein
MKLIIIVLLVVGFTGVASLSDKQFAASNYLEGKLREYSGERQNRFSSSAKTVFKNVLKNIDIDDGINCLKLIAPKMSKS